MSVHPRTRHLQNINTQSSSHKHAYRQSKNKHTLPVTRASLMRGQNNNERQPLVLFFFIAAWIPNLLRGGKRILIPSNTQIHVRGHSHHTLSGARNQRIGSITLFCADRVIISGDAVIEVVIEFGEGECSLMPSTNDPPGIAQGRSLH